MTPLGRIVRELIEAEGPIRLDRYMALALGHPAHGYYATRDPFGAAGDFTTAPEISQMFGELLGLWAAEVWTLMGCPARLRLVELGPGRGTLMSDALRAARALRPFLEATSVDLVETSPALRELQARTLAAAPVPVWPRKTLSEVPAGPAIILANELFDALPIRQFVRTDDGWRERLVGIGPGGALAFGLAPEPERRITASGRPGEVVELGEAAASLAAEIGARLARDGGAALIVDYGHLRTAFGETLQAVRRHGFADPLADPGEADLTAHVDFAAIGRAAGAAGARLHGPATQGAFLRALGIEARARRLKRGASLGTAAAIDAALDRLTGGGEGRMGELFKVLAVSHPGLAALPGLPPALGAAPSSRPVPVSAC